MKNRILLIGKSKRILKKLAQALTIEGFDCVWVNKITEMSKYFSNGSYDLVAFGRGILRFDKEHLKGAFLKQNPTILFIDGLAPITELLVAQIKNTFALRAGMTSGFDLSSFVETAQGLKMNFKVTEPTNISIDLFRINALHYVKRETLPLGKAQRGHHEIMITPLSTIKKETGFIVVKNKDIILDVQPVHVE